METCLLIGFMGLFLINCNKSLVETQYLPLSSSSNRTDTDCFRRYGIHYVIEHLFALSIDVLDHLRMKTRKHLKSTHCIPFIYYIQQCENTSPNVNSYLFIWEQLSYNPGPPYTHFQSSRLHLPSIGDIHPFLNVLILPYPFLSK